MDMLRAGLQTLHAWRDAHLAQAVIYRRGAEVWHLRATPGRTQYEVVQEDGLQVTGETVDFIVRAVDLVGGDPQPGDIIEMERGGTIAVFEVMDLGGQGHYRPGDPYGVSIRIHTKQVA